MAAAPISRGKSKEKMTIIMTTIMQNKANFRKSQVNIKLNITRDYEKKIEQDIW
jgi:hypothetical protein